MKGTIKEIIKQESGFIIYSYSTPGDDTVMLDNWASNLAIYECDLRKTRKVKSCLAYLESICGRKYDVFASPVTEDDLQVPGLLYDFDGFSILAPEGWA